MGRVHHNYTIDEMLTFLEFVKDILPIGPDKWDQMTPLHTRNYPGRDTDSIRRKYHQLHRKIPTCNLNCSPDVKMAKCVNYTIGDGAKVGGEEEDYDLGDDTFEVEGRLPVGAGADVPDIDGFCNG